MYSLIRRMVFSVFYTGFVTLFGFQNIALSATQPADATEPAEKLVTLYEECPAGMAFIPAGKFIMGDVKQKRHWGSHPKAQVILISRAYCMDIYEVTQGEFEKVMKTNPSYFINCGPDCPVDKVSWQQAHDYCEKLGKRLPTEAEWEKAARAGTTTPFWWGDTVDDRYLWHEGNSFVDYENDWKWPKGIGIQPVGLKEPNPYGLHDMAGNVSEWVQDFWWLDWHEQKPKVDPVNNNRFFLYGQPIHFVRGSSFYLFDTHLHMYLSHADFGDEGSISTGFRCAASLDVEEHPNALFYRAFGFLF